MHCRTKYLHTRPNLDGVTSNNTTRAQIASVCGYIWYLEKWWVIESLGGLEVDTSMFLRWDESILGLIAYLSSSDTIVIYLSFYLLKDLERTQMACLMMISSIHCPCVRANAKYDKE